MIDPFDGHKWKGRQKHCAICGKVFEKKVDNHKYCWDCTVTVYPYRTILMKMDQWAVKLKRELDQSGNPQSWRRGDPLEGLRPGIRRRIQNGTIRLV